MKTRLIIFLHLILFSPSYSQKSDNLISLKGPVQLPENMQIKCLVQELITVYTSAFKYFEELKMGLYRLEKLKANNLESYSLAILDRDEQHVIDRLKLQKLTDNGVSYLALSKDEENRLIDENKLLQINRENQNVSVTQIVELNNMLVDKEIMRTPDLGEDNKILNLGLVQSYVVNQNYEPARMFKMLEDVAIIPYAPDPKTVCVDSRWDNVTYMNGYNAVREGDYVSHAFGEFGHGEREFSHPSGITLGRSYDVSETYVVYPLFIADQYNSRVVKVEYWVNKTEPAYSYIYPESWAVVNSNLHYPYDIAYFKHSSNPSLDRI